MLCGTSIGFLSALFVENYFYPSLLQSVIFSKGLSVYYVLDGYVAPLKDKTIYLLYWIFFLGLTILKYLAYAFMFVSIFVRVSLAYKIIFYDSLSLVITSQQAFPSIRDAILSSVFGFIMAVKAFAGPVIRGACSAWSSISVSFARCFLFGITLAMLAQLVVMAPQDILTIAVRDIPYSLLVSFNHMLIC